jgi:LuxR family maltose regulon positive regulatory protein
MALAEHPDPERFVAEISGSSRAIADYLIAEALERQPPDVQRLLLRTSLLDHVNGELADLLTGSSGAERALLELEEANAFVVSLDSTRAWFRYHQLFGELLRLELRRTSPAEVPQLHRLAADWFADHAEPIEAIRHLQAAGDWSNAARLLADHAFSLILDGDSSTLQALLGAFPRGAAAPELGELALAYATQDIVQNRLDDASARLELAEQYALTTPSERQHRLQIAIAALELELAARRGHFGGMIEQVNVLNLLTSPVTARSNQDVALAGDLRAFALLVLGIVETWTLQLADAERHLLEGAALGQNVRRAYLEAACLARLGFSQTVAFAPGLRSFEVVRERCEGAITFAERHGWGNDRVIAPALATLAGTLVWTGDFGAAAPLLERAATVSRGDTEPGTRLLVHLATGMLHAGQGDLRAALEEFSAAEQTQSLMVGEHALYGLVAGWAIATRARLGQLDDARTSLVELSADQAARGEIRNATAVLHLAEGSPAAALGVLADVLNGVARVVHDFTLVESHLLAARAHAQLADHRSAYAAVENALAAAEADRLILPFVMTGSRDLLDDFAAVRDRARCSAQRHSRRLQWLADYANRWALVAPSPGAHRDGVAGAAVPADKPLAVPDRSRALPVREYGQHALAQHLCEARCAHPLDSRRSCAGAAPAFQQRRSLSRPIGRLSERLDCQREIHQIQARRSHPSPHDDRTVDQAPSLYSIRLTGHLGPTTLFAFQPWSRS